jgi:hypothetical protein
MQEEKTSSQTSMASQQSSRMVTELQRQQAARALYAAENVARREAEMKKLISQIVEQTDPRLYTVSMPYEPQLLMTESKLGCSLPIVDAADLVINAVISDLNHASLGRAKWLEEFEKCGYLNDARVVSSALQWIIDRETDDLQRDLKDAVERGTEGVSGYGGILDRPLHTVLSVLLRQQIDGWSMQEIKEVLGQANSLRQLFQSLKPLTGRPLDNIADTYTSYNNSAALVDEYIFYLIDEQKKRQQISRTSATSLAWLSNQLSDGL